MKAFINGKIYTVNEHLPLVEAVLINENNISLTGSNNDILKSLNAEDEVIDLKGKIMLPGFIDSHVHFMNGGYYLLGLDLRNSRSINDFILAMKEYAERNKGNWITGGNWDHENWIEKTLPVKEMIDPFTSNTPVFIERMDKHIGLANSLALNLAEINKNTPDPPGGEIDRNISGVPTGILKDNAMNLIYSVIPAHKHNENLQAAATALEEAKKFGITSIQDISYKSDLEVYLELEKENKLNCRIYSILPIQNYSDLSEEVLNDLSHSDKLKFNAVKAFADGSLGAGTAWFFEPYQNSNSNGLPQDNLLNGKFEEWFLKADKNKIQIATHAIGDQAIYSILKIYKRIVKENPNWDRRLRIEHSQHLRFGDISSFQELDVIASCQPYHLFFDGSWAEKKIGKERIKYAYPFKSMLKKNVKICFGSDWPVVPLNPLEGISSAATRETSDGENPDGWIPSQKISVYEAIKCYTINGAFASFEENEKGSIEPGKLADMVVLSEDIFNIPPEKIKDVKVKMTVFDGKIIYST